MNLYGLFTLDVNIKYIVFSILYRHINVPMACKESKRYLPSSAVGATPTTPSSGQRLERIPATSGQLEQDGTQTDAESQPQEPLPPAVAKLALEWVPLELSFGIPLFSESANKAVCDRVGAVLTPFHVPVFI